MQSQLGQLIFSQLGEEASAFSFALVNVCAVEFVPTVTLESLALQHVAEMDSLGFIF